MSSAKSAVRKKEAPRNLSSDQLNEIQEAFELFDSDKDGSINYHEFKARKLFIFYDGQILV